MAALESPAHDLSVDEAEFYASKITPSWESPRQEDDDIAASGSQPSGPETTNGADSSVQTVAVARNATADEANGSGAPDASDDSNGAETVRKAPEDHALKPKKTLLDGAAPPANDGAAQADSKMPARIPEAPLAVTKPSAEPRAGKTKLGLGGEEIVKAALAATQAAPAEDADREARSARDTASDKARPSGPPSSRKQPAPPAGSKRSPGGTLVMGDSDHAASAKPKQAESRRAAAAVSARAPVSQGRGNVDNEAVDLPVESKGLAMKVGVGLGAVVLVVVLIKVFSGGSSTESARTPPAPPPTVTAVAAPPPPPPPQQAPTAPPEPPQPPASAAPEPPVAPPPEPPRAVEPPVATTPATVAPEPPPEKKPEPKPERKPEPKPEAKQAAPPREPSPPKPAATSKGKPGGGVIIKDTPF